MQSQHQTFLGYDPGGNGSHGVAALQIEDGAVVGFELHTLSTAQDVINAFALQPTQPSAVGIDTLTCWSSGPSGWRPADRWMRLHYPDVIKSVVASNSMYGSMTINGGAVINVLQTRWPKMQITEVHPKVLYRHIESVQYNFKHEPKGRREWLGHLIGRKLTVTNEHEWDALLCAFAAWQGFTGKWKQDLHQLPTEVGELLVYPCGATHFFWPS